jgi:regulator of protease activity HflC (stomatin/prohibitin superfamily)
MLTMGTLIFIVVAVIFVLIILISAIKILKEYERGVIFRFGRLLSL